MHLLLASSFGAIQIIRDTRQCVTHTFFTSWNTIFKDVGGEKFYLTARSSFKRYFLSYSFHTLKQIRLKIGDQKREKCHTRGVCVRKEQKKCHVLFEWSPIEQANLEFFTRFPKNGTIFIGDNLLQIRKLGYWVSRSTLSTLSIDNSESKRWQKK